MEKGLNAMEINSEMVNVLSDTASSKSIVCKWALEFQSGRTSLEKDPRSRRPKTAPTEEMIDPVHDMVMIDRGLTVDEIAETIGIPDDRVLHILSNGLGMR